MEEFINFFQSGKAFQPYIAHKLNGDQQKKYEDNMVQWFQDLVDFAVQWGQAHIVRILLTPPLLFRLSILPLHFAIYCDHSGEMLKVLLECKQHLPNEEAEIELFAINGYTLLHVAAQCGSLSALTLLLDNTMMELDVNEMSIRELFTPLHVAAVFGKIEVVNYLLQSSMQPEGCMQKADPMARDSMGRTALHYAAREGHTAVVQELLSHLAMQGSNIASIADYDGLLPLHMAARAGHVKVIQLLRSIGSDINSQAQHSLELRELLLHVYSTGGECIEIEAPRKTIRKILTLPEFTVVKSIQKRGMTTLSKQIDALFWRTSGYTPLHFAARYGQEEAVQELLKEGSVNVELQDSEGFRAFDWMEVQNQGHIFLEYVEREMEGGCHIVDTIKAKCRSSKLSKIGRLKLTSELDEEKKAMDELKHYAREMHKYPPISFPIVKFLLKDMDESEWLRWAVSEGHIHLLKGMLKLKEIDVNAKGSDGLSALDRAVELQNYEAVKVILLHPELYLAQHFRMHMWVLLDGQYAESFYRVLLTRQNIIGCSTSLLRKIMAWAKAVKLNGVVDMILDQPEFKRQLYEDRQVYLDCANALLVGAALIGGVAFQAWLQPPLGYSFPYEGEGYADVHKEAVRKFWWFNNAAFFLAVGALIAGAKGAMPGAEKADISESVTKTERAVAVAGVLMGLALVCLVGAFTAAGLAVVPPLEEDMQIMRTSLGWGGTVCILALLWFSLSVIPLFMRLLLNLVQFLVILCPGRMKRRLKKILP